MTNLKEHSREICYPPPTPISNPKISATKDLLVTPTPIANKFCKVVFDPYPKGRFQKLLSGFFLLRGG